MFAYCANNPVNYVDYKGSLWGGIAVGAIDGPLPFADLMVAGVVAIGGFQAISKPKDKVIINIGIKKKDNKDTIIYRYGGTNPGNFVPSKNDVKENSGLSFSTIPKYPCTETTVNTLNATGVVYAVKDGKTHVSAYPVGATISQWRDMGAGSVWTQAIKALVVKWDGGR